MCSPPALNFPFAVVQRQRSEGDSRAKLFSVGGIMIKAIVGFAAIVALIETQALAADMALKAPPIPPQIYNWSGCHVGGTVGGAVGRSTYSGTPTGDFLTVEPSIIPKSFGDHNRCTQSIQRHWRRGHWMRLADQLGCYRF